MGLILVLIGVLLYVFPYLAEIYIGSQILSIFFALYICINYFLLVAYRSPEFDSGPVYVHKYYYIWIYFFLLISLVSSFFWMPVFLAAYGIALYHFDFFCRGYNVNRTTVWAALLAFFIVILVYMLFVWSGFGRILMLSYLLLPCMVLVQHKFVVVRWHILAPIVPLALLVNGWIRGMQEFDVTAVAGRSASHHLVLMNEFLNTKETFVNSPLMLLEQFVLLVTNWMPRALWPSKPIGAGSSAVDIYYGRQAFSESYSVSLGLWGEHILWLPSAWLFSGFASLFIVFALLRVLLRISKGNYAAYLCYLVSLISFFWGGMASFGSRVWFLVIPIFIYMGLVRMLRPKNLQLNF